MRKAIVRTVINWITGISPLYFLVSAVGLLGWDMSIHGDDEGKILGIIMGQKKFVANTSYEEPKG